MYLTKISGVFQMKAVLPQKLISLAKSCAYPLYIVGGTVRDFLAGLKRSVPDYDVCAPVSAQTFCADAKRAGAEITAIYANTGTVKLKLEGRSMEFASFRSDEYVRGIHRPADTFFTEDITLDARRRDFKCNAVYYDIKAEKFVDVLGGVADIENKRLSTVAEAEKVFGEDGLRLMRLARFAAQTGFTPTKECLNGALKNASLISDVSPERIWAELWAILHADEKYGVENAVYVGLKILDITRVLDGILPELTAGRGMEQPAEFHSHDVLEHSLRAAAYAESQVRVAALLHDIGKPKCKIQNGNYHGHETAGAELCEKVLSRLKAPKKLMLEVSLLCSLHMYDIRGDAREGKIRKLIVNNLAVFDKLLLLKQADFSACRDDFSIAPCVKKWKSVYAKMQKEGAPFTLSDLDIRGNELIEAGIPAHETGAVLKRLLEECALQPKLNQREKLLKLAFNTAGL